MPVIAALKRPSGFVPLVMSALALVVVALRLWISGRAPEAMHAGRPDEGPAAHIFQILISAQVPIVLYPLLRWLRTDPRGTLAVLAFQVLAVLAALAPVFLLRL